MKVESRKIRPIPRQAAEGWMCLGIVEEERHYYILALEPPTGVIGDGNRSIIHITEYIQMKRAEDLLDGDSQMVHPEVFRGVWSFSEERELLTPQRIEIAIRMAAAMSLSIAPPRFHHEYDCLMYMEKLAEWDITGRKSKGPSETVSTLDCWRCPNKFRSACMRKLITDYEEEVDKDRYTEDQRTSPKLRP